MSLLVSLIYLLPISIKDSFVLYRANPTFLSIFMSNYVHGGLVGDNGLMHLIQNIIAYVVVLLTLPFFIKKPKRGFYIFSAFLFLALPFILSALSFWFLNIETTQGFSGIVYSFGGYLIYQIIHNLKKPPISAIIILFVFLSFFVDAINPKINIIAHWVGFIVGVILAFLNK